MTFFQTGNDILDIILMIMFLVLVTYPIIGGFSWFIGVLCYTFLFKYKQTEWDDIPVEVEPFITIMVPAHNEEIVIENTIEYLMTKLNYKHYEVLVTDDGSTDSTPEILARLQKNIPGYESFELKRTRGKHMLSILVWGLQKGN
ncbi:glycosyl transferase [Enterococcus sp. DIV0181]